MKHTREHYRKEQWLGYKITERRKWDSWKTDGCVSAYQKAREEARRILATHVPEPLPTDVQREINAMLARKARSRRVDAHPVKQLFLIVLDCTLTQSCAGSEFRLVWFS